MKRNFYRFSPIIFGTIGIMFIVINYLLHTFLPNQLRGYIWLGSGVVLAVLGFVLGRLIQRLYSYGYTDVLTGVRNRGYFYNRLSYEMKKAKRRKTNLSLLMIDVDNFKLVNDTFGHVIGDRVLKQMAQTFVRVTGRRDTIARWGGEEFAIILPETDSEQAYKIAEELREAIEGCATFSSLCNGNVTISIGVATISSPMELDDFVKMSDKALYKAKERKNIVVCTSNHLKECKVSNL